jgi:hypothetical protein
MKHTADSSERATGSPRRAEVPAANSTLDESDVAREALRSFVRALARADAIEDYRRRHSLREGDDESGNLHSV